MDPSPERMLAAGSGCPILVTSSSAQPTRPLTRRSHHLRRRLLAAVVQAPSATGTADEAVPEEELHTAQGSERHRLAGDGGALRHRDEEHGRHRRQVEQPAQTEPQEGAAVSWAYEVKCQ